MSLDKILDDMAGYTKLKLAELHARVRMRTADVFDQAIHRLVLRIDIRPLKRTG